MNLHINSAVQTYWQNKLKADPNLRVHDLGDAFLHAIDEIVCKVSNYRQLIASDPVLKNNRSTILYFLLEQVFWVTVSCYFNKFILEDMGSYKPNYNKMTYFKEMEFSRVFKNWPDCMKLAISSHDCGNIFPQVDTIRIIVRQTSDKDKQLACQLGCLTNRAVEAMEDYITTLAPSSSSKVVRMKIPHYKCSITLDNGKNYEVSRSTGKHTNNLITLLDWISKNDPNFAQSRTLRLAPISQHEFYQSLVAASENNPESSKPCSVEMIEISPMAQLKLTG
jgi:hypothetical protein